MRRISRRMLPGRYTIRRPQRASNGKGGWTVTKPVIATGVRGAMQARSAADRENGDQPASRISHVWYCDGDVDVRRDDEIESEKTGTLVLVHAVRDPDELGHHLEVDVEETQRGA